MHFVPGTEALLSETEATRFMVDTAKIASSKTSSIRVIEEY
jgi:hypothetical protein